MYEGGECRTALGQWAELEEELVQDDQQVVEAGIAGILGCRVDDHYAHTTMYPMIMTSVLALVSTWGVGAGLSGHRACAGGPPRRLLRLAGGESDGLRAPGPGLPGETPCVWQGLFFFSSRRRHTR